MSFLTSVTPGGKIVTILGQHRNTGEKSSPQFRIYDHQALVAHYFQINKIFSAGVGPSIPPPLEPLRPPSPPLDFIDTAPDGTGVRGTSPDGLGGTWDTGADRGGDSWGPDELRSPADLLRVGVCLLGATAIATAILFAPEIVALSALAVFA